MRMGIGLPLKCGRSGSWSPAQLTSLAAWYEAGPTYCWQDAGCTVACGDGDPIYTWQDRSGNGYHLTQTDPLKRPTLRLVSGKWCARFDGVNDWMQDATGAVPARPHSVSIAAKATSTSTVFDFPSGNKGRLFTDSNYIMWYSSAYLVAVWTVAQPTDWFRSVVGFGSSNTFVDLNGVSQTIDSQSLSNPDGRFVVGLIGDLVSGPSFIGDIAGIIRTTNLPSLNERLAIDTYLKSLMP